jgi:hypothetical protein
VRGEREFPFLFSTFLCGQKEKGEKSKNIYINQIFSMEIEKEGEKRKKKRSRTGT